MRRQHVRLGFDDRDLELTELDLLIKMQDQERKGMKRIQNEMM